MFIKKMEVKKMKKFLICMFSVMIALGLSIPSMAAWVVDGIGDTFYPLVANKDIEAVSVEVVSDATHPGEAPWMFLCIQMAPESTLPGIINFELDVDRNVATGAGTFLSAPVPPGPLKEGVQGMDIMIQKVIREQGPGNHLPPAPGPNATMAWCKSCNGLLTVICAHRKDPVLCTEGTCYEMTWMCANTSDLNCFKLEDNCTGCAGGDATRHYALDEQCAAKDCSTVRKRGEWVAKVNVIDGIKLIGGRDVDWGRDIPKPPLASVGTEYCQKVPYGEILIDAKAAGADFDLTIALATAPYYMVSSDFDNGQSGIPAFQDQDDFVSYPTGKGFFDVTDVVPNGYATVATAERISVTKVDENDDCLRYQNRDEICLGQKALGYTTNFAKCRTFATQPLCAAAGCYWNPTGLPAGACVSKICNANTNDDGAVDGKDSGIAKKDLFRVDCPK